ncbi:MAG: hypothetical protein F7B17_00770 [Desulfurococcales archaeon]|nr:hypothetical protein [Desulfurococcales archaeon]
MRWLRLQQLREASREYDCFIIDVGWDKVVIYRFEGLFSVEDLKGLNPLIAVGYSEEDDPGPCAVALSYLYRLEDEGPLGPPRIKNPGLHVRATSLGLRQISDMTLLNEFKVIYVISALKDRVSGECRLLECKGSELYKVTSARVKNLR